MGAEAPFERFRSEVLQEIGRQAQQSRLVLDPPTLARLRLTEETAPPLLAAGVCLLIGEALAAPRALLLRCGAALEMAASTLRLLEDGRAKPAAELGPLALNSADAAYALAQATLAGLLEAGASSGPALAAQAALDEATLAATRAIDARAVAPEERPRGGVALRAELAAAGARMAAALAGQLAEARGLARYASELAAAWSIMSAGTPVPGARGEATLRLGAALDGLAETKLGEEALGKLRTAAERPNQGGPG
jgi:hypothetical protein